MDAYICEIFHGTTDEETALELLQWLGADGDVDDFIYFGEEARRSER